MFENPLFKLIVSLLKCTGCNNIYVFCTEHVEKCFVNIDSLCKGRIYLYSSAIILVLTVFSFFLTSFSISNVIEQGITLSLTSKVDENKKKMGEYIKNWQFV